MCRTLIGNDDVRQLKNGDNHNRLYVSVLLKNIKLGMN